MSNAMGPYRIRAYRAVVDEVHHDGGLPLNEPLRRAAVGVVFENPFAGRYEEDLSVLTRDSQLLGMDLGVRAASLLGAPVESYGKGGIAGLNGEQEHVVACVTTVFGNALRDAIGGGRAWISSATKVAAAGETIDIPLAYKDEVYVRSHYDALTYSFPGSPRPNELLICVAVASRGRPHERVGGTRRADLPSTPGQSASRN